MVIEPHDFIQADFVAGNIVLDFVNTATGRNGAPRDWLNAYGTLVGWASCIELFPAPACLALNTLAKRQPREAAAALGDARRLRELLFELLGHIIKGSEPPRESLDQLHRRWLRGAARACLQLRDGALESKFSVSGSGLHAIADTMANHSIAFLHDPPLGRLRMCDGPDCAWLFVDTSKAGRRRWCDMATCGNDGKAQRYQARIKRLP